MSILVLYLGGKDAGKAIDKAFTYLPRECRPRVSGSLLELDLMKRRRILHTLITEKPNMIEIVESHVITCYGNTYKARNYFSNEGSPDNLQSHLVTDSIVCTLDGIVENVNEIDSKRRDGKSDKDLSKKRAISLDRIYANIVTKRQLEGLIFKDLSSPYCFGKKYRYLSYWMKLKVC